MTTRTLDKSTRTDQKALGTNLGGSIHERLLLHLKRIYWSEGFKRTVGVPKRISVAAQQQRNKPIYCIDIYAEMGFFAVLQLVLFILIHCEEKRLYPDVSAHGGLYGDKEGKLDWFANYFDRIIAYPPEIEDRLSKRRSLLLRPVVRSAEQLGFRNQYERRFSLPEASQLFLRYYHPKADVSEEVNALAQRLSITSSTLGIHYRGTDKVNETGRVEWDVFAKLITDAVSTNGQITNILVSSDEQQFIDFFMQQNFARPVVVMPSTGISTNGQPVHVRTADGLKIGREALLTSLLLARCGFLIKTASYLSAWSKIFNPDLQTLLVSPVGRRPRHFPDSALWDLQRPSQYR